MSKAKSMAEQVLGNQTQPAARNDPAVVKYEGPWIIQRAFSGWNVGRDGDTLTMWRATRKAAQETADGENLIWRHRQVEQAASDLLEELKQARSYVAVIAARTTEERVHEDLARIDAALAKAEPSA